MTLSNMIGSCFLSSSSSWLVLLFVVLVLQYDAANGEIQTFDMLLYPDDTLVHYSDGYIRGPGYIDLSGLTFTAISEAFGIEMDDDMEDLDDETLKEEFGEVDDDDDEDVDEGDDDEEGGDGEGGDGEGGEEGDGDEGGDEGDGDEGDGDEGDGGGRHGRHGRRLLNKEPVEEEPEYDGEFTMVDVALFHLPEDCANTRSGCDWTQLGVGAKMHDTDEKRWCCSTDAYEDGICTKPGRLIINDELFEGNHRFVKIENEGAVAKQIHYGEMDEEYAGQYVVVFANCDRTGREITVTGTSVWKSKHGFLPGELFGFMYFYAFLTIVYFILCTWFGISMQMNAGSRIPIEKWILMTVLLGLAEMLFRTGDYMVWNSDGYRQYFIGYVGLVAGVLKQGISRCLIVMVSLGWGVTRDTLGTTITSIIVLGSLYICSSAARDLMVVFAIEDMQTLSYKNEVRLFDSATVLTFVIAAIDVIFIMWILDALNNTMEYLELNNQLRKLTRYLRLRTLFLFSILFATIWAIFALVDTYDEQGIVREEHEWVVDATTEVNYLFVLIGVACLWRPNPNAKEYAYVMELPALGSGDDDDVGNELELSGVVPSAMDDDDDDEADNKGGGGGGFRDAKGESA